METETIRAVRQLVLPSDGVLEVGSRYGTTSCEVAVMQNNSGNLVAVEPDHRVWAAAEVSSVSESWRERDQSLSLESNDCSLDMDLPASFLLSSPQS